MTEPVAGVLEVGTNGKGEVCINHPDLKPDENGVGHIVFSVDHARHLAHLLTAKANEAVREREWLARQEAAKIPVDRSKCELVSGAPVPEDRSHTELKSNGQQKDYVVLSPEERQKGLVRPLRRSYKHLKCGSVTTMDLALAETFARDPYFYSGTCCTGCGAHFPVGKNGAFVWIDDGTKVGI